MDGILWDLIAKYPRRARVIIQDGEEILIRFYIKHNGELPGIYLHRFIRGDLEDRVHNHPWAWAFSIILTGGYTEVRQDVECKETVRELRAGSLNWLSAKTFHRVSKVMPKTWTLFVSGPELAGWGYKTKQGLYEAFEW